MKTDADGFPCCDVCHVPATMAEVTVVMSKQLKTGAEALCKLCSGLIDSGLIRFDHHEPDGTPCYRRWSFEWSPGDLVPVPREV